MIARGLRVPRARGEEARRDLLESGRLRNDLGIRSEDEFLVLPLREGPDELSSGWGEIVEREFDVHARKGPARYRDLLAWPGEEKDALPRSFDIVGDIVLIRLPPDLDARKEAVGQALLEFVPGARLVGLDHGVHGPERRRKVERVAGSGPWRTRHKENGIELEVDVEQAYFSPRLAREHARVAEEVRDGDRVYDLCCGVGPFSATIAHRTRAVSVTAVDSNPEAIALLRATLARYPFGGRVVPIAAPLEDFVPSADPVERVVLNLPHEGIKYLPSVARTVAPGGRLYYYEVTPRTDLPGRRTELVKLLAPSGLFAVAAERVVHPYSPMSDLVAFVLERRE
ncbi:MAG: methyltransferase domain-containing protein [Thermoplasmata archaeon]|jgi:tRNA (guanine37-N1)-methyltransferase